jgi:adenylosuccinate synthase
MGVTKCYTTRVGSGPFPTELKTKLGESIREAGGEYGATTGRPRRVGWLDLVALSYSIRLNGVDEIALSKVDILSKFKEFKVCVAYNIDGSETDDFQRSLASMENAKPIYESPANLFGSEVGGGGLSPQLENLVDYLETRLRVEVRLVSYGEDRSKTLEL